MSDFDGARVRVGGSAGLAGGGVTSGELATAVSGLAPSTATYITQTANAGLSAEQALGSLATGILKNTTTTGVLSIATGADLPAHTTTGVPIALQFTIDGGGSAITTGIYPECDICLPANLTITDWAMVCNPSGSITIDIWHDSHTNYPPTNADSITSSAPVLITTNVKNTTNSRSGWTNDLLATNYLRVNVDSVTSVERVTLTLFCTRSV
jgi:hypothetical protein